MQRIYKATVELNGIAREVRVQSDSFDNAFSRVEQLLRSQMGDVDIAVRVVQVA